MYHAYYSCNTAQYINHRVGLQWCCSHYYHTDQRLSCLYGNRETAVMERPVQQGGPHSIRIFPIPYHYSHSMPLCTYPIPIPTIHMSHSHSTVHNILRKLHQLLYCLLILKRREWDGPLLLCLRRKCFESSSCVYIRHSIYLRLTHTLLNWLVAYDMIVYNHFIPLPVVYGLNTTLHCGSLSWPNGQRWTLVSLRMF